MGGAVTGDARCAAEPWPAFVSVACYDAKRKTELTRRCATSWGGRWRGDEDRSVLVFPEELAGVAHGVGFSRSWTEAGFCCKNTRSTMSTRCARLTGSEGRWKGGLRWPELLGRRSSYRRRLRDCASPCGQPMGSREVRFGAIGRERGGLLVGRGCEINGAVNRP